jgi:hypothetical protein
LSYEPAISIRRARQHDRRAIERLAALDSAAAPRGEVLLAEVDGQPWAALSVDDGHAVADPFRRSGSIVELLRARAEQRGGPRRERRLVLLPRWA